ncbi:hypothetical protein PR048_008673 [Dryococelus australis]|uniref:DNA helicase n=1 Tax=Dryococelus australis TaxID=614101 RepID=A0ABQ9HYL5_9NEOP|nr:hypothetical protein PR048_008673 [Dryococelus australis]
MIPTCENPGATPAVIEPGSLWWEAISLTTTPPRPQEPRIYDKYLTYMLDKANFPLNWTLQDIRSYKILMGGMTVFLTGNFLQILSVVLRGMGADEIMTCLKRFFELIAKSIQMLLNPKKDQAAVINTVLNRDEVIYYSVEFSITLNPPGLPYRRLRAGTPVTLAINLKPPKLLCFAMMTNKSQGQTLKFAGVDLRQDCFSHRSDLRGVLTRKHTLRIAYREGGRCRVVYLLPLEVVLLGVSGIVGQRLEDLLWDWRRRGQVVGLGLEAVLVGDVGESVQHVVYVEGVGALDGGACLALRTHRLLKTGRINLRAVSALGVTATQFELLPYLFWKLPSSFCTLDCATMGMGSLGLSFSSDLTKSYCSSSDRWTQGSASVPETIAASSNSPASSWCEVCLERIPPRE